jgi:hypothetical protein
MILHDWDVERCVQILRRCREATTPGGRIVIVETIIGDVTDPGIAAALTDLNMLVVCQGGRERSLDEFDAVLSSAGLRRITVSSNPSPHSVIQAVAA